MFKQLLATATAASLGLLAGTPALAANGGLDAQHQMLLDTLRSKGVHVEVNVPEVCSPTKTPESTHGVYFYAPNYGHSMMAICQDFGGQGEEVLWTDNDLDTLRHESVHFLQDCMDTKVDGEMVPLFDGPGGPSPIDATLQDVVAAIGYGPATDIVTRYTEAGVSEDIIRLELEAFFSAADIDAVTIAKSIDKVCPAY